MTDQLAHYGIKGMKWGIRKASSEVDRHAAKVAKAEQKAQTKRLNAEMGEVLGRRFKLQFGQMSMSDYEKLSTKGKSWASGSEFKRVVDGKNLNAPDTYVSTNKQDAYNYRVALGARFLGRGERHEITLKSVNRLTSPSAKERVDAFVELMDKPAIILENGKAVSGREVLKRSGYGRDVRRLDSTQLGVKYYNEFLTSQWMDKPINTAYFNEIKKRGYNSLLDANDEGIVSKEPLILLNPSGDVKRMSIKPLTKEDVKDAEKYFKAP